MLLPTCLVLLMVAVLVGMIGCIGWDIVQHDDRIGAIERRLDDQVAECLRAHDEAREETLR